MTTGDLFFDAVSDLSRKTIGACINSIALLEEAKTALLAAEAPALVSAISASIAEQKIIRDEHIEIVMSYSETTVVRKLPSGGRR